MSTTWTSLGVQSGIFFLHSFNGWIIWHYTQGMGRTKGFSPRHEGILSFVKGRYPTFNLDEYTYTAEVLQREE